MFIDDRDRARGLFGDLFVRGRPDILQLFRAELLDLAGQLALECVLHEEETYDGAAGFGREDFHHHAGPVVPFDLVANFWDHALPPSSDYLFYLIL
jgi:hypothetical protein